MSERWNLDAASTEALLKLPVTGMGFQFVEATVEWARKSFLVFNAEVASRIFSFPILMTLPVSC